MERHDWPTKQGRFDNICFHIFQIIRTIRVVILNIRMVIVAKLMLEAVRVSQKCTFIRDLCNHLPETVLSHVVIMTASGLSFVTLSAD